MFNARNPLAYALWLLYFVGLYFFIFSYVSEEAVWEILKYNDLFTYRGKALSPIGFFINIFFSFFPYSLAFVVFKTFLFVVLAVITLLAARIHKNLETLSYRSMLPYYFYASLFALLFLQKISLQNTLAVLFFLLGLLSWQLTIRHQQYHWLFRTGVFFGIASLTHWGLLPLTLALILSNFLLGNQRPASLLLILRGFLVVTLTFFVVLILAGETGNLYRYSFLYYFSEFPENFLNFLKNHYNLKLLFLVIFLLPGVIALLYIQGVEANYKIHFRHYETLIFHSVIWAASFFLISQDLVFLSVLLFMLAFYLIEFFMHLSSRVSFLVKTVLFFNLLATSYFNYQDVEKRNNKKFSEKKYLASVLPEGSSLSYLGNKFADLHFSGKYRLQVPMQNYELFKWHLKFENENLYAYYLDYYCQNFPQYILIARGEPNIVQQLPLLELFYTRKAYTPQGDKIYVLTAFSEKIPCR